MRQRDALWAFLATLISIVSLSAIAGVLAYNGKYHEAIGIGAAVTGLIGVLGFMVPKQPPQPKQPPEPNP